MYDAAYVPGGKDSVNLLLEEDAPKHFIRETYNHGKAIAATGERIEVLQAAGIASGPGVVNGKSGSDLTASFIEVIGHRHWNRPK